MSPASILLMILAPVLSLPETATGQDSGTWARVDSVFREMDTSSTPGCALSVMRDGAPVYLQGYGMANLEYGIPIRPSSVFHVASVSKQFTAFAVALLAAEGRVSWEDDIRQYVPEVPDFGERITLRHLANHTSGIRDQWSLLGMAGWRFEGDVITQGDVLDITSRQAALNFPVGEQYLYSNTGFTLLAVVVERVTGQTLKEFAQERVFGPLGMIGTHFHDDHNTIVPQRAYAYAPLRGGGYRISIPDFDVVGATSLHTTVEDLARWDRNFITGQVGGEGVLSEMHRRGILRSGDSIDYALGLTHGSYRGLPTVGHGGSDAGYRSQFLRFPQQGVSMAVLCNFPSSGPGALAQRVADVVLEDAFPEPPTPGMDPEREREENLRPDPAPLTEEDLSLLEGVYLRPDNDAPTRVLVRDGVLFLGGQRLFHQGNRVFRPRGSQESLRIEVTADGDVGYTGAGGRRYVRQPPAPDPLPVGDYLGHYWSDDLGTGYEVRSEGGTLNLWHRKLGSREMRPTFKDGFAAGESLTFSRDGQGRVNGFTMSSGRVWKVRFHRLPEGAP